MPAPGFFIDSKQARKAVSWNELIWFSRNFRQQAGLTTRQLSALVADRTAADEIAVA
jgi:hypothetical protein